MTKKKDEKKSAFSRVLERMYESSAPVYDIPLSEETLSRSAADVFASPPTGSRAIQRAAAASNERDQ